MSPTPVWKRIQKMEQAGVITRRVALLEADLVGVGLIVFNSVTSDQLRGKQPRKRMQ